MSAGSGAAGVFAGASVALVTSGLFQSEVNDFLQDLGLPEWGGAGWRIFWGVLFAVLAIVALWLGRE